MGGAEKLGNWTNAIMEVGKQTLKDSEVLEALYTEFLEAVDSPVCSEWNERSTFNQYLISCKQKSKERLKEFKKQRKKGTIVQSSLIEVVGGMDNPNPNLYDDLDAEECEILEFLCRRTCEVIDKFFSRHLKLEV